MHIVIHHAVQKEHPALQARRQLDCTTGVVAFRILLRGAHGSLRINSVVLTPVGGRRASHRYLKEQWITEYGHQCHVPTVTMPHDCHALRVDV